MYFPSIRILDNLPVVVPRQTREGSQPNFDHGYRVGYKVSISPSRLLLIETWNIYQGTCLIWAQYWQLKDDKYYINNHLSFKVLYHEDLNSPEARIVGFHVIPSRYVMYTQSCLT